MTSTATSSAAEGEISGFAAITSTAKAAREFFPAAGDAAARCETDPLHVEQQIKPGLRLAGDGVEECHRPGKG